MESEFDVICVGGGTAAEGLAAGLEGSGLSLLVVESDLVGGECPYYGCMPSKALLRAAETLAETHRAPAHAAGWSNAVPDFAPAARRISGVASGWDDTEATRSLEKQGAHVVRGRGVLSGRDRITVGRSRFRARRAVVLATGTSPSIPPLPGIEKVDVWTNRDIVRARTLPRSLVILGGGPVGVEFAQALARFGVEVTLVEMSPRILGGEDADAAGELTAVLEAEGVAVRTGAKVTGVATAANDVLLRLGDGTTLTAERLLAATGRTPNLAVLQGDTAGVRSGDKGIEVDPETLEAAPGIFAAGDITGLGRYTHLAWYHGKVIARRLRGEDDRADHRAVPRVTFTDPEVASVGMDEAEAKQATAACRVVRRRVADSARGQIHGEEAGFVKLIADVERSRLVGATVVSPRAGEVISELGLAVKAGIGLDVLDDFPHPFPTFSRILQDLFAQLRREVTAVHLAGTRRRRPAARRH